MKLNKTLTGIATFLLMTQLNAQNKSYLDQSKPLEERISLLLKEMTLEEKVGQMNQYNGFWEVTGPAPKGGTAELKYDHLKKGWVGSMLTVRGVKEVRAVQKIVVEETRLGIPLIIGFDVIHGYKTLSPIPLAEAASWDLEAIKKSAQVAALEASASGINWTFGPNVDVTHEARWGRIMEGAGEDPFLGSKIAKARVQGFQGDTKADLLKTNTIAATAKHFAAYGYAEAGLEYNRVEMGNAELYNMVLPPFKAAKEAGVRSFMNGFNLLNGIPVTGSGFLQRKILKKDWKFDGFVITDYSSIREMIAHGFAKDESDAATKAVVAGADMDMESYIYVAELAKLVREGKVKQELIDDAVTRILRVKFELGLFDDPYKYLDEKREKESIGTKASHEAVLDMARKSIVLLKNDKNLLPLKKSGQKIALIGELAADKNSPLGSWRIASDDNTAVSVLEGLQKYKGNQLTYEKGADVAPGKTTFIDEVKINTADTSEFEAAKTAAKNADVVIIVLGEHGFQSGEGRSRTDLGLPGVQQELLEEVYNVNPNIVLVLNNGRPLAIPWAAENIPAIVEAWQLGTETGNAVAEVLYGDYNPGGKLPVTFPRNVGQLPVYYNHYSTGRYNNTDGLVFWSHYIDSDKTPQFAFGHGLSYTTFEYSDLKIEKPEYQKGDPVKISVKVSNTGNYDGKEIVQLYIHDVTASLARPVKELKGFENVFLRKGETKTVNFVLTDAELGFYTNEAQYLVEPGTFEIFVGGSSDKTLTSQFELK
ncbi:beta-glucosidase BglX [Kaistella sp. 97-N-M2]|uniref:beta-glucosidase BglX n=1 Tax=Kaistella sp. 97-N-M2 TaxID=2908645 RepID=UPI001F3D36DA|nr:beta-glucosidase BglX [Kaistella sp. 97-N-M2]UJF29584.1 beta-glucosidase BglX [Kaistella sp. 97-N-M2]